MPGELGAEATDRHDDADDDKRDAREGDDDAPPSRESARAV